MTAKQLLIPRYEVIADFPDMRKTNIKSVGDILTDDGVNAVRDQNNRAVFAIDFEKYPHLFRKMNWWEKRTKEEMPKKLKSLSRKDEPDFDLEKEDVHIILSWNMEANFGYVLEDKSSGCDLTAWKPEYGYIPVD